LPNKKPQCNFNPSVFNWTHARPSHRHERRDASIKGGKEETRGAKGERERERERERDEIHSVCGGLIRVII